MRKNIKRNFSLVSFFYLSVVLSLGADDNLAASANSSNSSTTTTATTTTVTNSPTVSITTAPIFSRTNEIYSIFQILQQLEFEQVPEASLTAPIVDRKPNSRTNSQAKSTASSANRKTVVSQSSNDPQIVSQLKSENSNLERMNAALTKELENVRSNRSNTTQINQVLNNIVEQFSQERASQDSLLKEKLTSRISTLENTLVEQKARLNNEPEQEDKGFSEELLTQINQLKQSNEKLKNENQLLQLKIKQSVDSSLTTLLEKEQRIKDLEREIADLRTIQSAKNQNKVTEKSPSSNELTLTKQIAEKDRELVATRKALSEEQSRSKKLNNQLAEMSNKLNAQSQQQQTITAQNQSQELINLRQRVQQAEIINQKIQQELLLAETNLNQKQAMIDSLNSENSQIAQQFTQQINELNQSLANARRAEAEANRWARSAGGGNPSVSAARLASLQQELESLRSSDEKQRFEAITKQQQIITLQNQLSNLQNLLNSEQQSKKLLEEQILKQNETATKKITEPVVSQNKVTTKDSTELKKPLSTSAGLQGIAR